MRSLPLRHIIPVAVIAICIALSVSNHYTKLLPEYSDDTFGFGAPPPPPGAFPQALLLAPGVIVALPVIIVGAVAESNWIVSTGMILGGAFFWHCVGWAIDCSRGVGGRETPPRFVSIHFRVLSVISTLLFPLGLLVGFRVGSYYCAVGKPPYWSEMLMFGIQMTWISIGAAFTMIRFLRRRQEKIGLPSLLE